MFTSYLKDLLFTQTSTFRIVKSLLSVRFNYVRKG